MRGLRATLALFGVGLCLAAAGVGAAKAPAKAQLFGFVPAGQESWSLIRLDPLTLTRRAGRAVRVGDRISAWSFSPDASKLVVGSGIQGELMLVDTKRMRSLGRITLGGQVELATTFWPEERRLYAVVTQLTRRPDGNFDRRPTALVAVDPTTRAVVGEQSLDGYVHGWARRPGLLALILGPESGIGPARLAVVTADGAVRTVSLEGVSVGFDPIDESNRAADVHYRQAGLALAPDGSRAYVASPGQLAAVDLRTLAVAYHRLGSARSLQKGALEGSTRFVHWVRDGLLLVTGFDDRPSVGAGGEPRTEVYPVGARLVDTRDWSVKTLDPGASYASVGVDAIALMGVSWSEQLQRNVGHGFTIYSLTGVKRAHLFGTKYVDGVVVGRRAFVARDPSAYSIVSTTTGRMLRSIHRGMPLLLQ